MKNPACGNHKVKCPYRTYEKTCKRPREFSCKFIIKKEQEKRNE